MAVNWMSDALKTYLRGKKDRHEHGVDFYTLYNNGIDGIKSDGKGGVKAGTTVTIKPENTALPLISVSVAHRTHGVSPNTVTIFYNWGVDDQPTIYGLGHHIKGKKKANDSYWVMWYTMKEGYIQM